MNINCQCSSDISVEKEELLGPAHVRAHSLAVISVQETKSWDDPSLELPKYVCYGSKFGLAMLLVSELFCTTRISWKFEERCKVIIFGTSLVEAVHAPDSSKSLETCEACVKHSFQASLKSCGKDVDVEPKTSTCQVIPLWIWE